ncbi:MAG TPA: choice-of-anchor tandem repeat GloVer-containing protein [Candidatus Sulfotelmatobacter sp.]
MKHASPSRLALALAVLLFTFSSPVFAQFTINVLHNFRSVQNDGSGPEVAPVMDSAGNLYGITSLFGANAEGMAYELSPSSSGWTYTIIYQFTQSTASAAWPNGGLILDAQGNLYGVSQFGGANNKGTVYELSPGSSGWTQTVLYSFAGGSDGESGNGSLIFDSAGNLYGTTNKGGANGSGTVFELSPSASGWTEQVLYTFTGGADGANPGGNLLIDSAGRIYGMAIQGGTVVSGACIFGCGTIFRLTNTGGTWRFARLFNFQGITGGSAPVTIAFDSAGNIYGSASAGGSGCGTSGIGCGTIFKLTPPASAGPWREKVLHAFNSQQGASPTGVAFDSKGNLYGTCFEGAPQNEGNVWQLSPTTSGPWTFTTLFAFGKASDGYLSNSGVIVDATDNLYGTTTNGGANGGGTVFELSPAASEKRE